MSTQTTTTSATTTLTRLSRAPSLHSKMDSSIDKEERKREYNRLAQREFRRRRKDHLKNLEQAQKEQSSEQSEEIERLRYQNDELRRENESLRAQVYGPASSSHSLMSAPLNVPSLSSDGRAYSLSPSISGASMSGTGSPPASLGGEMMPMSALSLTSSMLPSSMQAYADPALSSQPYPLVHQPGLRHNAQSSPGSSGFRTSRSAVGTSFQSLNVPPPADAQAPQAHGQRRTSSQSSSMVTTVAYDRAKARAEVMEIFRPMLTDPAINTSSDRHLAVLRSLSDNLPGVLQPSKAQLETPHYYGVDLLPSPSLRDRLLTVTPDVAQSFVTEIGIMGDQREDMGQLIIWGQDALNEMSWEFSQATLERWGWLLGREWVTRTNFWRQQRGINPLPDW